MRILLTGSSGLIGSALTDALTHSGQDIVALIRQDRKNQAPWWQPAENRIHLAPAGKIDAVIHLAGENIAVGRWTAAQKQRIRQSRVHGTRLLCQALTRLDPIPKILICASAVGFYGNQDDRIVDETHGPGDGFLADVCRYWERASQPVNYTDMRVIHARLGVILSPHGGMLKKMLLPFRMGFGGVVGIGKQYLSWITLSDVVNVIQYCLNETSLSGPVNLVTPNPVTNREFTKTLGKVLHRPTFCPVSAFIIRTILGEMGKELILASTRVKPTKLIDAGFEFEYPVLEEAFNALLNG